MNFLSFEKIIANAVAFCDTLSLLSSLNQKLILSDTDKEHIELTLDTGITRSRQSRNENVCILSEKHILAHLDLTGEFFLLTLTDLGGKTLCTRQLPYDGRYFFDENVSFFIKDAALFTRKYISKGNVEGCSITVPIESEEYRGTKGILTDRERLICAVRKCFGIDTVIYLNATEAQGQLPPQMSISKTPVLLVTASGNSLYAAVSGGGLSEIYSSFHEVSLCSNKKNLTNASDLVNVLFTTVEILMPRFILLDKRLPFTLNGFAEEIAYALHNSVDIIASPSQFSVLGASGILRRKYVEAHLRNYLSSEKGKKLWNITR